MKCTQQSHTQFKALARQPTFQHALPQLRCKMYPTGILRTSWNIPAQIQGPWLPPGSTEFMPGIRSPSLVGRHPALSPCLAEPQHPGILSSSCTGTAGLWEKRSRPCSALPSGSAPTPSTFLATALYQSLP